MKKRYLSLLLAGLLTLGLTACGGTEPEESSGTEAAQTVQTETRAPIPEASGTEEQDREEPFVGSIYQKGVPQVRGDLVIWDKVDDAVDLKIDGDNVEADTVVCKVPPEKLHNLAFSHRLEAEDWIREPLERAYTEILQAESLEGLTEEAAKAVKACGMDPEKLVVRDLIHMHLDEEYDRVLQEEQNYLAVSFDLGLREDEKIFVLHYYPGETEENQEPLWQWEAIYGDRLLRHPDGSLTVAFDTLSPIAFVTESQSRP